MRQGWFPPFGSVLAEFGLWELGLAPFWAFFAFFGKILLFGFGRSRGGADGRREGSAGPPVCRPRAPGRPRGRADGRGAVPGRSAVKHLLLMPAKNLKSDDFPDFGIILRIF